MEGSESRVCLAYPTSHTRWRRLCNRVKLLPLLPLSKRRYRAARCHTVCVAVCVCVHRAAYHVSTACRISLCGEGIELYPVLSSS